MERCSSRKMDQAGNTGKLLTRALLPSVHTAAPVPWSCTTRRVKRTSLADSGWKSPCQGDVLATEWLGVDCRSRSTAMSEPQCYYNETIAFFYNRSGKYLATEWNTVSKLVMGLGITVCIFIMLANLLVMVAIYVNRRFHFPIYYLMANLAAADFFAGLAYFYLMFNTGPNTRRLTVSTWLLRQGLIDTSLTASVANLLAIAIERHITVFRMQLHTRMSNRRVVVVIVVIWTMAIVMGAIPSVGWNCICDITHCSNMAPLYSDSYLVFWAIFNLVTFVVMVVLYAHIFGYVRQRTMRMSRHSSGPRRNRDTMMSLLKTVVIVLAGSRLCGKATQGPSGKTPSR
ncbi:lysophosphatidic acid receptor 1 isoform X6 [Patagioenas fasciata]|uniref:lysophosphatidic acid receptor 1 isoform X6 n=1 Tax=Patagioenas fasciata TaxID=372321 RepID=UPI003A997B02